MDLFDIQMWWAEPTPPFPMGFAGGTQPRGCAEGHRSSVKGSPASPASPAMERVGKGFSKPVRRMQHLASLPACCRACSDLAGSLVSVSLPAFAVV